MSYIVRKTVSNIIKNRPCRKLTLAQRKRLEDNIFERCVASYFSRMKASGMINDEETLESIRGQAWEEFQGAMDRFDMKRIGKLADKDKNGKKSPKSLEFYFLNWFNNAVNTRSLETFKNNEGQRLTDNMDEEQEDKLESKHEPEETEPDHRYLFISNLIANESEDLKAFFYLRNVEG